MVNPKYCSGVGTCCADDGAAMESTAMTRTMCERTLRMAEVYPVMLEVGHSAIWPSRHLFVRQNDQINDQMNKCTNDQIRLLPLSPIQLGVVFAEALHATYRDHSRCSGLSGLADADASA